MLALPISIAVVLISAAFGRKVLALLRVKTCAPIENFVFGIGIGFGVLAYVVLAAGLAGWLRSSVLVAIMAAMAAVSLREIGGIFREALDAIRTFARVRLSASGGLIGFSLVVLGALALIESLAPPSQLDWDGLAYHLAVPKMYLSHHSIFYVPFISHSNFPFLTEMLYTVGLSFGSTAAAKLFHFWMYVASAAGIYSLCRRHFSPLTGVVGALLFMSAPVVFWEAGVAYTDITTGLYVALAVYALLNWGETGSTPWLVVCGLVGGFALGTKVLAGVPILALCLWILIAAGASHGWGRGLRLSLVVGGIVLLVGSPWYVKSYVYTGNPVYPFLYDVFGGKFWSQEAAAAYRGAQLAFGMGRGVGDLLLLPWNLTVNGYRFFDIESVFGLVGMAFVGLIPIQVMAGRASRAMLMMGLVSAVFVAAWFVLMQQSRYLIGVLPLLSIIAASGVEAASSSWSIGRHAVNGFVALCVGLSIVMGLLAAGTTMGVVLGVVPRDEYLSRTLDIYDAQSYINRVLPENARVILFDEVRGFYLDREYIWGNPGHHEMIPWAGFKDGADMVRYFEAQGFTHALVNWKFARDDFMHRMLIGGSIARGLMREVYAAHGVSVYELGEE